MNYGWLLYSQPQSTWELKSSIVNIGVTFNDIYDGHRGLSRCTNIDKQKLTILDHGHLG